MELNKPADLLALTKGSTVTKRKLFDLIQYSKVAGSKYWGGAEYIIGNTPQQGINWIGEFPDLKAVIIKTTNGSYAEDGWSGRGGEMFHYSFKAKKAVISYEEKANRALINQPQYLYPVLLFTGDADSWAFQGRFDVSAIEETFVALRRSEGLNSELQSSQHDVQYLEGGKHYVTHLLTERSREAVAFAKQCMSSTCDICSMSFEAVYGVRYIEVHHKVPISSHSGVHVVRPDDLALLCPNCHGAVHIYMREDGLAYEEIKKMLADVGRGVLR